MATTTLIVGDQTLAGQLASMGHVITVDSYLHALGEMSRRTVDAVVGRIEPMSGTLDVTVAALRQMAPTSRLILLVDADQEPMAMRAVRLGMDDYLVRPVTTQQIARALGAGGSANGVHHDQGDHGPSNGRAAGSGFMERDRRSDGAAAAEPSVVDEVDGPVPASGSGPMDRKLGDTDLIAGLLSEPEQLTELALTVIRQRLGGAAVTWSPATQSGSSGEPVIFDGRTLGYLSCEGIDRRLLKACADWLGHWLGLGRQMDQLRGESLRDELTGVWNRRHFDRFLSQILARARKERFRVTLMVYDIDNFKAYNDRHGHGAGDEILRETAKLMASVVRKHDVVARIGGDEFAVIFWDGEAPRRGKCEHPQSVLKIAQRFQRAVCDHRFPKLAQGPATLTISGGLASYPWDGLDPQSLLERADEALLESKRQGKNCLTFGPGAMRSMNLKSASNPPIDSDSAEA